MHAHTHMHAHTTHTHARTHHTTHTPTHIPTPTHTHTHTDIWYVIMPVVLCDSNEHKAVLYAKVKHTHDLVN